ncbi:transposase [Brevundimonas sp.]|uniref:transposase n=1 Tax=Brevundimonas sp. TaxID=1871086 RepID=UPI00356A7DB9
MPGPTVIAPPSTSGARALPADAQGEGDLRAWIERGRASLVASFANGIDRDINAVRAAITSGWSNGQAEGQIAKFKLFKRRMCGGRKLDLLQARLIGSTP